MPHSTLSRCILRRGSLVIALALLMLWASRASAGSVVRTLTLDGTAAVSEIEIADLTPKKPGSSKSTGLATLKLATGAEVMLTVNRKYKARNDLHKYSMKSVRGTTPKVKIKLTTLGQALATFKLSLSSNVKSLAQVSLTAPGEVEITGNPTIQGLSFSASEGTLDVGDEIPFRMSAKVKPGQTRYKISQKAGFQKVSGKLTVATAPPAITKFKVKLKIAKHDTVGVQATFETEVSSALVGDWYYRWQDLPAGAMVRFLNDGTYVLHHNLKGVFTATERGTYSYNEATRRLSFTVTWDDDGELGFGEGPGDGGTVTLTTLTPSSFAFVGELPSDDPEEFDKTEQSSPTGAITDSFGDGVLDSEFLWHTDIADGVGTIDERNGGLYIATHASGGEEGDTELCLSASGYTEIQADLKAITATADSDMVLKWRPIDDDIDVQLGLSCSSDGEIYLFVCWEVYGTWYCEGLMSGSVGTTYTLKMTWDGERVRFFVNGALMDTYYEPDPGLIVNSFTRDIKVGIWCPVDGGSFQGWVDNFSAK